MFEITAQLSPETTINGCSCLQEEQEAPGTDPLEVPAALEQHAQGKAITARLLGVSLGFAQLGQGFPLGDLALGPHQSHRYGEALLLMGRPERGVKAFQPGKQISTAELF